MANYERMKLAGVNYRPYWCINHGMTLSFYYSDPDGNQSECQVDAFHNAEEANAFMSGPLFKRNPIGVEVDPDELLARFRAGEPERSLPCYDTTRTADFAYPPGGG